MLAQCRATTRRASNAIASCSYFPTRHASSASRTRVDDNVPRAGFAAQMASRRLPRKWGEGKPGAPNNKLEKDANIVQVKSLKPIEVSNRVKALLGNDQLDHAITMVENLPMPAQNVVIWNILISAAIEKNRFKLAFELYYDMKRRHFVPNTRTYSTIFAGLSRIDDWTTYKSILQRVYMAYDQLIVYFEKLKATNPNNPEINTWPINGFINVLGKAQQYQKMWDVFFSMEGALKPDAVTYHLMLKALEQRSHLADDTPTDVEEPIVAMKQWKPHLNNDAIPEDWMLRPGKYDVQLPESTSYKNASDARLIWDYLVRAAESPSDPVEINAYHICSMLHLLARGRPSDHHFAFDIIQQYLRLEVIDQSNRVIPPSMRPSIAIREHSAVVPINPIIFTAVLDLCIRSGRIETAIFYYQKLAEDPKAKEVIDVYHMVYILRAFAMRRAPHGSLPDAREAMSTLEWMIRESKKRPKARLIPTQDHFIFVLTSTWRAADMAGALRIFELVTGYQSSDFMDGSQFVRPAQTHLRVGDVNWNVHLMALLIKTAAATQKQQDMRIALRILGYLRPSRFFFTKTPSGPIKEDHQNAQKELATRMLRGAEFLLSSEPGSELEEQRWAKIRDIARQELHRLLELERSRHDEVAKVAETAQPAYGGQRLVSVMGRKSAWNK